MRLFVLIYRDQGTRTDAKEELARLRKTAVETPRCGPDHAMSLLIAVGEFEAALADAMPAKGDVPRVDCARARQATLQAARLWIEAREEGKADTDALSASLSLLAHCSLPASIILRISEGFAYYGLFPDSYVLAAQRFLADQRPTSVVVLGIRSIGTSLSAVVAATLESNGCRVTSSTVRPAGHPFDRRLCLSGKLATDFRNHATEGASFAIVDEGPGLSGSSFASVVDALESAGISPARIALFPSWDANADRLRSGRARGVWRTHKRYCVAAKDAGVVPDHVAAAEPSEDWSAGRWRESVYGDVAEWPGVQPQHERWKVRLANEQTLIRFAGLGEYGERTALRARTLSDAGLGEKPGDLRGGFLDIPFVRGAPVVSGTVSASEAGEIGRYIGCIPRLFRVEAETDQSALAPMLETNVVELLGGCRALPEFVPGPVVGVDGRMLAHEWLRTATGLRKVDALDHHCDHFFAGATDPAWDLAGASIELALDESGERAVRAEYVRVSGDTRVSSRLPFYRAAYAAFRGGYCAMQADALDGSAEGERFARARERYVQVLRRSVSERHL